MIFGRSLRSCGASSWARTTDCLDTSGQSANDKTIITANKLTTAFLILLLTPVLTSTDAGRGTTLTKQTMISLFYLDWASIPRPVALIKRHELEAAFRESLHELMRS